MSVGPLVTVVPAVKGRYLRASTLFADYWALTKPEVNFLILITTFAGFYLGCANAGQQLSFLALFNTLFGTLLVASGTGTLNQYIERKFDAQMRRTARRPLAGWPSRNPGSVGLRDCFVGVRYYLSRNNRPACLRVCWRSSPYSPIYSCTRLSREKRLCAFSSGHFPVLCLH